MVELAIEEPAWGQVRVANELKKQSNIDFTGRSTLRLVAPRSGEHQKAAESFGGQEPAGGVRSLTEAQMVALEKAKEDQRGAWGI